MATDFHLRVEQALERAVAAPPAARDAVLGAACADDTRVLREARARLPFYLSAQTIEPRCPTALGRHLPGTTTIVRLRTASCATVDADSEPHPPFTLEQYTAVQVIGRGGMGVVYRALEPVRCQEVAIKILRCRLGSAADYYRLAFECEILRQLRHPGIARFSHSGIAALRPQLGGPPLAARPYLVMEYVHGQPLTWYAAARRLSGAERVALLLSVCDAMAYAHHRGVVHCDLKPDNTLVDAAGTPRIVDFGIARFAADGLVTATHEAVGGTRAYASPEQFLGRIADIGPQTDVFALGIIAHELLTGARPRRRGLTVELDLRNAAWRPGAPAALQRLFAYRLDGLLASALRLRDERRLASAGEFGAALGCGSHARVAPRSPTPRGPAVPRAHASAPPHRSPPTVAGKRPTAVVRIAAARHVRRRGRAAPPYYPAGAAGRSKNSATVDGRIGYSMRQR